VIYVVKEHVFVLPREVEAWPGGHHFRHGAPHVL